VIDRITETCDKLARHPRMGIRQDQYRAGLRCFPVGKYVIFYHVTDDGLEIYRVLHGARQLEDLL
jgi:toxin ParE1/3/4